jgi:NADH:ubiquinone oxidoreductase subunit E
MRVITVCVGSACHLKGSHEIIAYFKKAIEEAGLEGEVELKGTLPRSEPKRCTEDL